jgi:hypothetical protein
MKDNLIIERLQNIMNESTAEDHHWWDSQTIIDENKTEEQIKRERIEQLNEEGVTRPLHKHNIETYEKT